MTAQPHIVVVIPTYNHGLTVRQVARGALGHFPVIVVDDGSTDQTAAELRQESALTIVTLPRNQGKGAALIAGFAEARRLGFSHTIVMDADGQHSPDALPAMAKAVQAQPGALIVGVRDLRKAGAPRRRRLANGISSFWFRVTTGVRLGDTQCGYRAYPLGPLRAVPVKSGRYAFEIEILIKAAWAGVPLVPIPVEADYAAPTSRQSHFRPVADMVRISRVYARLATAAFCVPRALRALSAGGELRGLPLREKVRTVARHFFTEHTETSSRLALAVGMGLFCGIAPIWGYQMVVAALLAHKLRLNKAIALTASNISIPLVAPFILAGGLILGHYLRTGLWLRREAAHLIRQIPLYLLDWVTGSLVLAAGVGACGALLTWAIAGAVRRARPMGPT